jgi:hypothetical protein
MSGGRSVSNNESRQSQFSVATDLDRFGTLRGRLLPVPPDDPLFQQKTQIVGRDRILRIDPDRLAVGFLRL